MSYWWFIEKEANFAGTEEDQTRKAILDKISRQIPTRNIKMKHLREVDSIPDIWSTHALYDLLLIKTRDSQTEDQSFKTLRRAAMAEWRAMLATLVLSASIETTINTIKIDLSRFRSLQEISLLPESESDAPYRRPMEQALFLSRPKPDAFKEISIYNVKESLPIAVSSPTSFFVPTPDAWDNLRAAGYEDKLTWLVRPTDESPAGVLDPIDNRLLPMEYAIILRMWLRSVYESLTTEENVIPLDRPLIKETYEALDKEYHLGDNITLPGLDVMGGIEVRIGGFETPPRYNLFLDKVYTFDAGSGTENKYISVDNATIGGVDPSKCIYDHERKSDDSKTVYDHFFIPMPLTDTGRIAIFGEVTNNDQIVDEIERDADKGTDSIVDKEKEVTQSDKKDDNSFSISELTFDDDQNIKTILVLAKISGIIFSRLYEKHEILDMKMNCCFAGLLATSKNCWMEKLLPVLGTVADKGKEKWNRKN